ncbi:DUF4352 domain-containing protein [Sphaerisporangium perillae]|uniref:DUF4352 domain-containing protein n=1 Tax=Sphaerisporangium perillae TaxID=2935860 RepID=UPI00200DCD0D|nr:DUF4352 domain-containing protein [Sphaerisporangium perillae]
MTTPEPSPGRTESRRGPLRPWIAITAVVFTLATVLALAWPAGGLREAKPDIPHRRLGETTTGHRFAINPHKVSYATKDPAPAYGDAKDGRFLTIEFEVENVSDQTATVNDLAFRLYLAVSPGSTVIDRFKDKTAGFVIRDGRYDREQLQPGLPERVMIVYTVPAGRPDPTSLTLSFEDQEYTSGFQSELSEWYPGDMLAIYDLEVGR